MKIYWPLVLFLSIPLLIPVENNIRTKEYLSNNNNDSLVLPWHPLHSSDDLDPLINSIGDAKVVLLGESTHGTKEFYEWRTAITKRLIAEKGFDFIAVEGDWTDSYQVNKAIGNEAADDSMITGALKNYDRWPGWMWGNEQMLPMLQWLRNYNKERRGDANIKYYGLDLYGFWEWTENVNCKEPAVQNAVEEVRNFFSPYGNDAMKYGQAVIHGKANAAAIIKKLSSAILHYTGNKVPGDENSFMLQQEALLAVEGERYFRTMTTNHVQAVNMRDRYMAETIRRLLNFHGKNSKAIVWVHNGHAGDAHYSDVSDAGYTSAGEILRHDLGRKNVFSIGMGTYKGFVTAGYSWGWPVNVQPVLPAKKDSWEDLLHSMGRDDKLILSAEIANNPALNKSIEFRSIGAAYSGAAIYSRSIIPQRFDAFLFVDSTNAIVPLNGIKR